MFHQIKKKWDLSAIEFPLSDSVWSHVSVGCIVALFLFWNLKDRCVYLLFTPAYLQFTCRTRIPLTSVFFFPKPPPQSAKITASDKGADSLDSLMRLPPVSASWHLTTRWSFHLGAVDPATCKLPAHIFSPKGSFKDYGFMVPPKWDSTKVGKNVLCWDDNWQESQFETNCQYLCLFCYHLMQRLYREKNKLQKN